MLKSSRLPNGVSVKVDDKASQSLSIELEKKAVATLPMGENFYEKIQGQLGEDSRLSLVYDLESFKDNTQFEKFDYIFKLKPDSKAQITFIGLPQSGRVRVHLEERSDLELFFYSKNDAKTHTVIDVYLEGENAYAQVKGLSIINAASEAFYEINMHHKVSHCRSDQFFKNILSGRAKSGFVSLVHVYADAQKSDSKQLNKNLILSDYAVAYSEPLLKIQADDVACSHGSATGQIEDSELFYLQSRGIAKDRAKFLLTFGFAEEVIENISDEKLKTRLDSLISGTLNAWMNV